VTAFGVDRSRKDGLNLACRACNRKASASYQERNRDKANAAVKAWRDRNPTKARAHGRAAKCRKYGLTVADYEAMVAAQSGACAVCGREYRAREFHIDHWHVDGHGDLPFEAKRAFVRELLCDLCNIGLGHAKDDPRRLERAAAYLEAYGAHK
jgi:hypothetical protein